MNDCTICVMLAFMAGLGAGWYIAAWQAYRIARTHEDRWEYCENDDLSLAKYISARDLRREIERSLIRPEPKP